MLISLAFLWFSMLPLTLWVATVLGMRQLRWRQQQGTGRGRGGSNGGTLETTPARLFTAPQVRTSGAVLRAGCCPAGEGAGMCAPA